MIETRFEGIVIGHENWGDADRLISFYTPHYGKIEAVAKGVRYEKSKLKGHLELLMHGQFMIVKRRGRGVIIDAISYGTFAETQSCVEAAYMARAVASYFDAYIFPHAVDEDLWQLLHGTLEGLRRSNDTLKVFESFVRNFLRLLGYFDDLAQEQGATVPAAIPSLVERMRRYDALLAHTDIAGPGFFEVARGLETIRFS